MYPANFQYVAAKSVDEAVNLLKRHGDEAKILAGGHSLIPTMKLRLAQPSVLIDLAGVAGLSGIREQGGIVVIGAMTTHTDVAESPIIRQKLAALAESAEQVGDAQVRNRGTIGGSCAHADPNSDEPVALAAFEATFTLVGSSGRRQVAAKDFFIDVFTTALQPDEVLTEISVPVPAGASAYAKMRHPASGFVVVSCAAVLVGSAGNVQQARLGMGGLGGAPIRAAAAEGGLTGALNADKIKQAASRVAEGSDPVDDLYAPAEYKRAIAGIYAERAINQALSRLK